MPDLQVNRLDKALKGLAIGVPRNLQEAQERAYKDGLIEREEQFQIAIGGNAEEFFAWSVVEVKFGTLFVNATGNRDSELEVPHFTYGASIETDSPVGVLAAVMEWKTTDRLEIIGCDLAIGVAATDRATRFKGFLHATFQGFGQPNTTFRPEDIGE